MIWQTDEEMMNWLLNLWPMNAGDFLQSIAEAAMRADHENYEMIRPLLLQLKSKYPKYDVPRPEAMT
ncbi:MAG: hypothetical protein ACRD4S_16870 [Candidatus Acidiferrales bacterium]